MSASESVLDGLGPAFRATAGPMLEDLVAGLTSELDVVAAMVAPTAGGWAAIFDLDTTPQPRWLGAATGTAVPGGLTLEQQRTYVRDRAAWRRGSLDALAAAIGTLLTTPQRVGFIERRDGNAWRLQILIYDGGSLTADQVLAAAATQKPVGMVIDGVTFVDAITYNDLGELFDSYEDLADAWSYPLTIEDDMADVTWWRPAAQIMRIARVAASFPTCADLAAAGLTCRELRDLNPQEA